MNHHAYILKILENYVPDLFTLQIYAINTEVIDKTSIPKI